MEAYFRSFFTESLILTESTQSVLQFWYNRRIVLKEGACAGCSAADPEWFFRIRILFSWFRIRNPFQILHEFFMILGINFTFVFLPFKCERLLIMTRYKLLGEYFSLTKRISYLETEHFSWKIVEFYQFFRVVLRPIHFGPGAARIRNYFSGSGSCCIGTVVIKLKVSKGLTEKHLTL